jgi:hypothetical protein
MFRSVEVQTTKLTHLLVKFIYLIFARHNKSNRKYQFYSTFTETKNMKLNSPDDAKLLLPTDDKFYKKPEESTSLSFKVYVITSMTFLWTGYTLFVRHSRSTVDKEHVSFVLGA